MHTKIFEFIPLYKTSDNAADSRNNPDISRGEQLGGNLLDSFRNHLRNSCDNPKSEIRVYYQNEVILKKAYPWAFEMSNSKGGRKFIFKKYSILTLNHLQYMSA